MSATTRVLLLIVLALATMAPSGCSGGGIGMSVPSSGARWGGGPGPDVMVAGGPR